MFASSQAQTIAFQKIYGCSTASGNDLGQSVSQTSDAGYILAGFSDGFGNGANDIYLVKTDSLGDTLWTKTYGTINEDYAYSVQQTFDGGYVIVGNSDNSITHSNVVLLKTFSNGNLQWYKTYIDTNYESASSVWQTSDGGYILTGTTTIATPLDYHINLIKANSNGDTLWTRRYGVFTQGNSVQQTSDGGYIIAGNIYNSISKQNIYLIKTNSNGDTIWTKKYGGSKDDQSYSVRQTMDGGYIITGYTESFSALRQIYLIKANSNGDTLWTKIINNQNSGGIGMSVVQISDGYVVTGFGGDISAQTNDVYLIKTDSNGDTLWTKTYGGTNNDYGYSLQQTADRGYVILGFTESYDNYDHYYLIKTDSLGNTIPFPPVGIADQKEEITEIHIYPNPFIAQAHLILPKEIETNRETELIIYDIMGNETARAVVTSQNALIERGNLPAGMYFCKVISNNMLIVAGKFIVL